MDELEVAKSFSCHLIGFSFETLDEELNFLVNFKSFAVYPDFNLIQLKSYKEEAFSSRWLCVFYL